MKLLSVKVEHERDGALRGYTIWPSDASILTKYNETASVVLAVDGKIFSPHDRYLRQQLEKPEIGSFPVPRLLGLFDRCAGVIEATDHEMEILAAAGYRLTDLRKLLVAETVKFFLAEVRCSD
jgi:hypothetical protein